MSVRQPATPQPSHHPAEGEVSLRVLLVALVALALGAIAWRFPFMVNPMLVAVATYAVFDRLTERRAIR